MYKLEVQLVSRPLNHDVVCQVSILSDGTTAVEGADFVLLNSTVTIPAGQNLAYAEVECLFEGLSEHEEKRTVAFELKGPENAPVIPKVNQFSLSMMMKCKFEPEDFEGTYVVEDQSGYAGEYPPYEVELSLVSYDELTQRAVFESVGLYEQSIPVMIILQENPDGSYSVTIPKQEYFEDPDWGMVWIENVTPGTFSPCELTIQTNYKIYDFAEDWDRINLSIWTKIR